MVERYLDLPRYPLPGKPNGDGSQEAFPHLGLGAQPLRRISEGGAIALALHECALGRQAIQIRWTATAKITVRIDTANTPLWTASARYIVTVQRQIGRTLIIPTLHI